MAMRPMTILKSDLPAFLAALAGSYRVVGPRRVGGSDVVFAEWLDGAPVELDFVNSVVPPKMLFFPARETLFHIDGARHPRLSAGQEAGATRPLAIFGIRSCDATGLAFLEKFFAGRGFEDDTILARIGSALTMTLACREPGADCFCVCCEGGPWLTSGFDIQFSDLGDALLADVRTEKGEAAVAAAASVFVPAAPEAIDAWSRQLAAVDGAFERRSYMAAGTRQVSLGRIPQEKWEQWAEDCQDCGGCCFVCPTCSCFTVTDRPSGDDAFDRERQWDACLYEGFTREASGHNPRAAKAERLKRRFFHKMSYQYIDVMGRHGCVGCGRCVATCMGGLDISTLLTRIHDECQ
jgi:sulfhydrogenase subunit beta (sulfur reductase)